MGNTRKQFDVYNVFQTSAFSCLPPDSKNAALPSSCGSHTVFQNIRWRVPSHIPLVHKPFPKYIAMLFLRGSRLHWTGNPADDADSGSAWRASTTPAPQETCSNLKTSLEWCF